MLDCVRRIKRQTERNIKGDEERERRTQGDTDGEKRGKESFRKRQEESADTGEESKFKGRENS